MHCMCLLIYIPPLPRACSYRSSGPGEPSPNAPHVLCSRHSLSCSIASSLQLTNIWPPSCGCRQTKCIESKHQCRVQAFCTYEAEASDRLRRIKVSLARYERDLAVHRSPPERSTQQEALPVPPGRSLACD